MTDTAPNTTQRLIVLGSTGSIGVNTLEVVQHLNRAEATDIRVVGLAAGRSIETLIEQAKRFEVQHLAIADPTGEAALRNALPEATIFTGPEASRRLVEEVEATDVAAAIVGSAGLPATIAAIERGSKVHLSNKETLVAAGALVTPLVKKHGATLIPVDSEHSAIFQCLTEQDRNVARIVLTASGGPFRTKSRDEINRATLEQALDHPTWNMGPKITIDSASMMNKALEIIEAHWLFDLPGDKIEVIVHPQSIMHSFVEFADHSILAQLGPPDMKTPIQYAMTWPCRAVGCSQAMDWSALRELTFEPPDFERFPSLGLAFEVVDAGASGGTAGAVFNAANEAAVAAFLERRIAFGRIFELVSDALSAVAAQPVDCLDTVLDADRRAREFVTQRIAKRDLVQPTRN